MRGFNMGFTATLEQDKSWRERADKEGYIESWNDKDNVILLTEKGKYKYNIKGKETKLRG